jgi:hypothetical protein
MAFEGKIQWMSDWTELGEEVNRDWDEGHIFVRVLCQ